VKALITGHDEHGRGCVVETVHIESSGDDTAGAMLSQGAASPPRVPAPSADEFVPAEAWGPGVPPRPGLTNWMVVQYQPGVTYPRHQTPTVDFDTVLAGSIELLLDDGAHLLEAGDCVVVNGVDHGWRAGDEGAAIAVLMLGADST
jgi:quercetin dioxygenase-like cupin family protein